MIIYNNKNINQVKNIIKSLETVKQITPINLTTRKPEINIQKLTPKNKQFLLSIGLNPI